MSLTSKMYAGTCRALRLFLIAALMFDTSSGVNRCPVRIFKNKSTRSSESCGRLCPTHNESSTLSENCSMTVYISPDPKRTPLGFRTPSLALGVKGWEMSTMLMNGYLLPKITSPLVTGLTTMKSPCLQTPTTWYQAHFNKKK